MTSYGQLLERFPYWPALKHSGLLIAPARLAEHFPDEPAPLPSLKPARDRPQRAFDGAQRAFDDRHRLQTRAQGGGDAR